MSGLLGSSGVSDGVYRPVRNRKTAFYRPEGLALEPSKIVCAGKNYAAHVAAMGDGPAPAAPLLFLKPPSALARGAVWLPPGCTELHPEVELVAVIGRRATGVGPEEALEYVAGYAAGLDMTDRALQRQLKEKGHPWELAKAFDGAAALGPLLPAEAGDDWRTLEVFLEVDGERLQRVDPSLMSTALPELVAHASARFTLEPGDLLFTGAPGATAPVSAGAVLCFGIEGQDTAEVTVSRERGTLPG
jgi:2-keto-4-pentenoate hydratase/2-oxohepta-3-ene-1,7-dioic acid hydratase in catechol pathway